MGDLGETYIFAKENTAIFFLYCKARSFCMRAANFAVINAFGTKIFACKNLGFYSMYILLTFQ